MGPSGSVPSGQAFVVVGVEVAVAVEVELGVGVEFAVEGRGPRETGAPSAMSALPAQRNWGHGRGILSLETAIEMFSFPQVP
jgi:hypothetical protein